MWRSAIQVGWPPPADDAVGVQPSASKHDSWPQSLPGRYDLRTTGCQEQLGKTYPALRVVSRTDFLLQHNGRSVDDSCAGSKLRGDWNRSTIGASCPRTRTQVDTPSVALEIRCPEQGALPHSPQERTSHRTIRARVPLPPNELPPGPSLNPHQARPFFARFSTG
jgi:hypothetical protein